MIRLPSDSTVVMKISSSGHEIELDDPAFVSVMMPRQGLVEVDVGSACHSVGADQMIAFLPSHRRTRVFRPGKGLFKAHMIKVPVDSFHRQRQIWGQKALPLDEDGTPLAMSGMTSGAAIIDLIDYFETDLSSESPLLRGRHAPAFAEALMSEHIRALFNDEKPGGMYSPSSAAVAKVRQAEEYMRTHHAKPLTVPDIAKAVGVGPRKLQYLFRGVNGQSPWEALTATRLDRAREHLIAGGAETSVTDVALACGFTHLGRFSGAYRDRFGETPSQTKVRRS